MDKNEKEFMKSIAYEYIYMFRFLLPGDVVIDEVKLGTAKLCFGKCGLKSDEDGIIHSTIILCPKALDMIRDEDRKLYIRITILHEIAHAIAPHDHHGNQWKAALAEMLEMVGIDSSYATRTVGGDIFKHDCYLCYQVAFDDDMVIQKIGKPYVSMPRKNLFMHVCYVDGEEMGIGYVKPEHAYVGMKLNDDQWGTTYYELTHPETPHLSWSETRSLAEEI